MLVKVRESTIVQKQLNGMNNSLFVNIYLQDFQV